MADKKKTEKVEKGEKGSTARKVKHLQKQYNKILVDLFSEFAPECIEQALEEVEGSFGENIQGIITSALEQLRGKVQSELGVKDGECPTCDTAAGVDSIAFLSGSSEEIPGVIDADDESSMSPEEHEEHEESETSEEEAEEKEEKPEEEKEEKEEGIEEKKVVKEDCFHDQEALGILYENIYKK